MGTAGGPRGGQPERPDTGVLRRWAAGGCGGLPGGGRKWKMGSEDGRGAVLSRGLERVGFERSPWAGRSGRGASGGRFGGGGEWAERPQPVARSITAWRTCSEHLTFSLFSSVSCPLCYYSGPHFLPLVPPPRSPHPPPGHSHTFVWVQGSCLCVLRLIPSPSFLQHPACPPPPPL